MKDFRRKPLIGSNLFDPKLARAAGGQARSAAIGYLVAAYVTGGTDREVVRQLERGKWKERKNANLSRR